MYNGRRVRWYRQSISQQQAKPFHCPTQLHPLNSDGCFQIHLLPKLWLIAQGSQKAVKTLLLAKPGGIFLPLVELITYLEAFGSTHTHTHPQLSWQTSMAERQPVRPQGRPSCAIQQVFAKDFPKSYKSIQVLPSAPCLKATLWRLSALLATYPRHFPRVLWTNTKQ